MGELEELYSNASSYAERFGYNTSIEWKELVNNNEGEKLKKIISIDGKTMRGSASAKNKALHIVSAYSKADGICF